MESGIQYWQVKIDSINTDKSGISIGLTSDRNTRPDAHAVGITVGCAGSIFGATSVMQGNDYIKMGQGDVIGFLVDFIQDEVCSTAFSYHLHMKRLKYTRMLD